MKLGMQHFTEFQINAIATCGRTLAKSSDLSLSVGDSLNLANMRGQSDAAACRLRFALPPASNNMRPCHQAGLIFDQLVAARAEAMGFHWLPGVRRNLIHHRAHNSLTGPLAYWAFSAFTKQANDKCPAPLAEALSELAEAIDHPMRFAQLAGQFSRMAVEYEINQPPGTDTEAPVSDESIAGEGQTWSEEVSYIRVPEPQVCASSNNPKLPGIAPPPLADALLHHYRIFDAGDDRVVEPCDFVTPQELEQLQAKLESQLIAYRQFVIRLAHRLRRRLLATQNRHWSFDQEEGQLDPSRLSRWVASKGSHSMIFRTPAEIPSRDLCVTLLLDNSGSMQGHPIAVTAVTASVLSQTLERCGIPVEILGYTTAGGSDNQLARRWLQQGQPPEPGRLNSLRHIIYKAMDTPWRRARNHLGLMLKDGLLKENIDGEALFWAAQRLLRRPENRRLLIVISDGAPMDQATLSANPRDLLDRHLHEVIAWVENSTDIKLKAIGIGHPVGRYYRNFAQLRSVDDLATVLLKRITDWLL